MTYQINNYTNMILRMFNQASNERVRDNLKNILEEVASCGSCKGSVIAETLLKNLSYANPRCSEAQAKAVACTAFEYNIVS